MKKWIIALTAVLATTFGAQAQSWTGKASYYAVLCSSLTSPNLADLLGLRHNGGHENGPNRNL